jgi:hypothetical protein
VRPFFGRFKKPSQQGFSELKSSVRVFGVSPSGNTDDQARVLSTCLSSRRENANACAEKIAKKTNSNEIGFARLRKDKDNAVIYLILREPFRRLRGAEQLPVAVELEIPRLHRQPLN